MMEIMIYPGTFDPWTNGHQDIAERAARLCGQLIVLVMENADKRTVFSLEERAEMAGLALSGYDNIVVKRSSGLLIDFYREVGADCVLRGIRRESDFGYESTLAAANRMLLPGFETLLMLCRPDLAFMSSTIVRDIANHHGDLSGLVPSCLIGPIRRKYEKPAD